MTKKKTTVEAMTLSLGRETRTDIDFLKHVLGEISSSAVVRRVLRERVKDELERRAAAKLARKQQRAPVQTEDGL
jgi:hypothetical protein